MSVLDVQNLTLSFGENTLFSDVSFDIKEKEKVGLIGCNGAGKTSLFKIIIGEYTPDSGACFISKNVRLGYMQQHTCSENRTVYGELVSVFDDLIETERRLDEISALLLNNPKNAGELIDEQDRLQNEYNQNGGLTYKSMTRSALLGLGFDENDFDMPTSALSGGQRSKLILAKLLLSKADFLLLDEPTNHLDMESITALNNGLIKFPGVILFTSHDHQFVQTTANRIMEILPDGKLIDKITTYDEYLASDEMAKKRHVFEINEEDASDN